MKNTLQKGSIRTIVFNDGNTWYGVALEFNIVLAAETAEGALSEISEAINGYVESLAIASKKIGGFRAEAPLNQTPDAEYEDLWNKLEAQQPIPSPYQVSYYGRQLLNK